MHPRVAVAGWWVAGLCALSVSASAGTIVNGGFDDPAPLAGFTATGTTVSEPTGEFAQLATDGTFVRTLEQTFVVPPGPTTLSFDFAFSTAATTPIVGFPDSFAVSLLTTLDGDFLDIMVVDAVGVVVDPSDGIEFLTGAVPIDVELDPGVSIAGFVPFVGGTTFSGRISVALPGTVLSEEATLYFDLFDEGDGFETIAAVDNVEMVAREVPEPPPLALAMLGLAAWLGLRGRGIPRRRVTS